MSHNSNTNQAVQAGIDAALLGSTVTADRAELAKRALERVCSGAGLDPAATYYCETFVDHVNAREFHSH